MRGDEALRPVGVREFDRRIEARFADGHTATIGFDGKNCTCGMRQWGWHCRHVAAAMDYYRAWKWRRIDGEVNLQTPGFLREVGIDPRVFRFRVGELDWEGRAETEFLSFDLVQLSGLSPATVYVFRDGAQIARVREHPEGWTLCSLCRSRECRHARDARQAAEEVSHGVL